MRRKRAAGLCVLLGLLLMFAWPGCVLFVPLCIENNDCAVAGSICLAGKCVVSSSEQSGDGGILSEYSGDGGGKESSPDSPQGTKDTTPVDAISCTKDADCSGGWVCRAGLCREQSRTCNSELDCPDTELCEQGACVARVCERDDQCPITYRCNTAAGFCKARICQSKSDCAGNNELCLHRRCTRECVIASDCKAGLVCGQERRCVTNTQTCIKDTDCGLDKRCLSGVCAPGQPDDGQSLLLFRSVVGAKFGGMVYRGGAGFVLSGSFNGVIRHPMGNERTLAQQGEAFFVVSFGQDLTIAPSWFARDTTFRDSPSDVAVDKNGNTYFWKGKAGGAGGIRVFQVPPSPTPEKSGLLLPNEMKSVEFSCGGSCLLRTLSASHAFVGFFASFDWIGNLTLKFPSGGQKPFDNNTSPGSPSSLVVQMSENMFPAPKQTAPIQLDSDTTVKVLYTSLYPAPVGKETLFVLGVVRGSVTEVNSSFSTSSVGSNLNDVFLATFSLSTTTAPVLKSFELLPNMPEESPRAIAAIDANNLLVTGSTKNKIGSDCTRTDSLPSSQMYVVTYTRGTLTSKGTCRLLTMAFPKSGTTTQTVSVGVGIRVDKSNSFYIVGEWTGALRFMPQDQGFPYVDPTSLSSKNAILFQLDASGKLLSQFALEGNGDVMPRAFDMDDSFLGVAGLVKGKVNSPDGKGVLDIPSTHLFMWQIPRKGP